MTSATRPVRSLKWLMVLCAVVPVALFAYATAITYEHTWAESDLRITRNLDVLGEYVIRVMETVDGALREADAVTRNVTDTALADDDETAAHLRQIVARLPHIRDIWVISAQGSPLASSAGWRKQASTSRDRDFFLGALAAAGETYIGQVEVGHTTGQEFFGVSRRVLSASGQERVIVAAISIPKLQTFLHEMNAGLLDQAAILRTDGRFLARVPDPSAGLANLPRATGFLTKLAAAPRPEGFLELVGVFDGVKRRIGYRRLAEYPLYIQSGVETSSVTRQVARTMATHLLFGVPATLSLLALSWFALRKAEQTDREEAARREAEDRLREARRLEGLGRLTGGVAHDFNNLLMIMQGGLGLLKRRIPDERALRQIGIMEQAVQRGAAMTGQLLSFARRQVLKPEPIDVGVSLREVAAMAQPTTPKVTWQVRCPEAVWPAFADPGEFQRALLNLCRNAADAMPAGGTLTLSARNVPGARAGSEADQVATDIRDTGEGIAQDVLPRIFEPFFTTKGEGRGTGLGLSQVHGFAEQSGGRLAVTSTPGEGSVFTLFLPRAKDRPRRPGGLSPEMGSVAGCAILVVEDNEEVAETVAQSLEGLGGKVVRAGNAASALQAITVHPPFDLVLSDVMMPGHLNGLQLATQIRKGYPQLPVILMSGYTEPVGQAEGLGFPLLRKPFGPDDFLEAVALAMGARTH